MILHRSVVEVDYQLVTPANREHWRAYHDIRRQVLFEARGMIGVYDENHPDDTAPAHHPKLLIYRGDPVGVIRVDIDPPIAIFRRVAIRSDVQRRGHGRALLSLAQRFAEDLRCVKLVSHVAPDAVGFYLRLGFVTNDPEVVDRTGGGTSILMTKWLPDKCDRSSGDGNV